MCNWSLAHCQPPPNPPLATKKHLLIGYHLPFWGPQNLTSDFKFVYNLHAFEPDYQTWMFLLLWEQFWEGFCFIYCCARGKSRWYQWWASLCWIYRQVFHIFTKKYVSPTPVSCIVKEEGTWCSRGWWMSLIYVQLTQPLHCTCLRKWSSYNVMEGICRGLVVFVALLLRDVSELGG